LGQLTNHLSRDAAEQMLWTPHYWALRRVDPTDNSTCRYIAEELRDRARAMDEMKLEVDLLAHRWSIAGHIVVPDTNILLHHVVPF
jgi:hypothetical protein